MLEHADAERAEHRRAGRAEQAHRDLHAQPVDTARAQTAAEADSAAQRLAARGLDTEAVALEGDAAASIVRYAAGQRIGTVVMGSRGHTGLARLILGSEPPGAVIDAGNIRCTGKARELAASMKDFRENPKKFLRLKIF